MQNNTQESWEEEFEKYFDRRHTQLTHLKTRSEDCEVCVEDREKNPKGYYKTFLSENKCYWNSEMEADIKSFIRLLLSKQAEEISEAVEEIKKNYHCGACDGGNFGHTLGCKALKDVLELLAIKQVINK